MTAASPRKAMAATGGHPGVSGGVGGFQAVLLSALPLVSTSETRHRPLDPGRGRTAQPPPRGAKATTATRGLAAPSLARQRKFAAAGAAFADSSELAVPDYWIGLILPECAISFARRGDGS